MKNFYIIRSESGKNHKYNEVSKLFHAHQVTLQQSTLIHNHPR